MKKVYVVANQKGGVGKTTTATAMASILNRFGHKTLLIDADPSMNSTDVMRGTTEGVTTLYDVILNDDDKRPLEEAIQETKNGYIVPSDPYLIKSDSVCSLDPNGLFRLSDAIQEANDRGALKDFDYIVIDTQPVINTLLNNCLIAADEVVIPVTADRFPVNGLYKLNDVIKAIQRKLNNKLKVTGLLLVMYNPRQKLSKSISQFLAKAAADMNTELLDTAIRSSVAAREAQANRMTLIDYESCCTTELDYEDFVNKILENESEV